MKYTEIEKKEAEELLAENNTISSMLKSLTLTTKYTALKNKIYNSTTSREVVIQNELDFIVDFSEGVFELIKADDYIVVGRDREGDRYILFPNRCGAPNVIYTDECTFTDVGFDKKTAETLATAIHGTFEPV